METAPVEEAESEDLDPIIDDIAPADVDDLAQDFNYKPRSQIEMGIERFIDWYKEFYKDKIKL